MRGLVVFLAVVVVMGSMSPAEARRTKRRSRPQLVNAVRLPTVGDGYRIPKTWANRGLVWGTRDLVTLIQRSAKRVSKDAPGSTLYVADLSRRNGGATAWHKSHRSGRDVDLLFFAVDEDGDPQPPPRHMIRFDEEGVSEDGSLRFDAERNWALVKALITDRVRVRRVFIAAPLEAILIDHATASGERASVVRRAAEILHQPSDSSPHDDHMHVRIDAKTRGQAIAKVKSKDKPKSKAKPKPSRSARRARSS